MALQNVFREPGVEIIVFFPRKPYQILGKDPRSVKHGLGQGNYGRTGGGNGDGSTKVRPARPLKTYLQGGG
jgi:hypothetical protein